VPKKLTEHHIQNFHLTDSLRDFLQTMNWKCHLTKFNIRTIFVDDDIEAKLDAAIGYVFPILVSTFA